MGNLHLSFEDLDAELREIGQRYNRFANYDLFVLWFLRAYVTESVDRAADAIVGGPRDKSLDALLIDDGAKAVFLVQGKYRKSSDGKAESRSDVIAFAELAERLHGQSDEEFRSYVSKMDTAAGERLRLARKRVKERNYSTYLYFVTTARVASEIRKDVEDQVKRNGKQTTIDIIDGKRLMLLFRDYLDGVAPPIPTLDLEMESSPGVKVNGVAQRFDLDAKVESWVFSMRGDAVARLYERAGLRLFARNIRGFMGDTPVNRGMLATLKKEPGRFFYYNNGITILCDDAQKTSSRGQDVMRVGNPQVINGQQTTRTLAHYPELAAKASVLVKVIQVPRDPEGDASSFEQLVSCIVQGTNWQNAIKPSDLVSNDRRQIELERALRKLGYFYIRKRQSKAEARRIVGKAPRIVTKDEFAQVVAGCEMDPAIVRAGKERLFEEQHYPQVFPNSDPNYYLPRYWLALEVTKCSRGSPSYAYAKWLVLNFMWNRLRLIIPGAQKCRAFRVLCERAQTQVGDPLKLSISEVFKEAMLYHKKNSGKGDEALDISTFFKSRRGHHKHFVEHWRSASKARQRSLDKCMKRIEDAVLAFET